MNPTYSHGCICLRPPQVEDARAISELVEATPSLDANSPYAYLLLCSDFAATGAVAEVDDRVVGFVLGYRPPAAPDTWFVWQVSVSASHQGQGLASALLGHVLGRLEGQGVSYLEATVTPSNEASRSLFGGLARDLGVPCIESTAFSRTLFPAGSEHEEETRMRIGPFDRAPERIAANRH